MSLRPARTHTLRAAATRSLTNVCSSATRAIRRKLIAQFLARAVVDEVLPPSFLQDPLVEGMGGEMVEQAKVLLSIKHGVVRLENVWGPGEGSTVAELKKEILL